MDKRYILAFLFALLILLGYPYYLKMIGLTPRQEKSYEKISTESPPPPTPQKPAPETASTFPFRNKLYDILFTGRGGSILLLAQGGTSFYKAGPGEGGIFGVKILHESEDLTQEIFEAKANEAKGLPPRFVYEKAGGYRLTKSFFVGSEKSTLVLELELENLSAKERHFSLALQYALEPSVHTSQEESMAKMLSFSGGELRTVPFSAIRKNPVAGTEPFEWHGLAKKYYTFLVRPDWKPVGQETRLESGRMMSEMKFTPLSIPAGGKKTARVLIYAGPLSYQALKEFGLGFEKVFSHGALGLPRVWLLTGLDFFHRLARNYGVAILIITLLIKLLFTPFTHLSYQSMGKMQALQPKVKALQQQHQKDPSRLNKEIMELYRRNRVNPMAGCLPLVIQIPIFIAFYQVLSEAVELKGAEFIWWIHDLSEPDRLLTFPFTLPFVGNAFNLLPILMIGSMVWQQKLTPQNVPAPGQEKIMLLMPIIFGFVFYNLPSGLVLYWLINNLLTIFHQLFIKRIPVILHHEDR